MLCRQSRNLVTKGAWSILHRNVSDALIEGLRPMEDVTRRLIGASATGDSSYNHRDAERLWSVIPQADRSSHVPPSLEKSQFLAQNHVSPTSDPAPLTSEVLEDAIAPGTFVELRRNSIVTLGIIIQTQILESRKHAFTLTYTGEIWPHLITDITYIIPGFISQDLLERAGDEYEAVSAAQTTARLQIVEQVRTFTRQHERQFNAVAKGVQPLYEKIRNKNSDQWGDITTPEATKFLDFRSSPPVLTLFAMHTHLMRLPLYYVADPQNHKTTHRFAVRPLSHVQTILQVNDWVRNHDPVFESFVQTARIVIKKSREIQEAHWDEPPSRFAGRLPSWSPTDLTFIRFLQNALRTTRATQDDPYDRALPSIIKAIDMYRDHAVSPGLAQLVLTELGVLAPWDDAVTRMPMLRLDIAPPGQSREAQTVDELVQHSFTQPNTPVPPILRRKLRDVRLDGSTQLLQHNPLEDGRHDFGDLRVYVVDEASAEELDDGLSIEDVAGEPGHYWVHVHVADPTTIIPPGHVLDMLARRNAITFYSSHRTWPMIPPTVSRPFSLGSKTGGIGQEVLTFSLKMNDKADFLDYKIRTGLVHNVKILTYDQADDVLNLENTNTYYSYPLSDSELPPVSRALVQEEYHTDLRKLHQLAYLFFQRTLNQHTILNFTFPRASIRVAKNLPTNPLLPPHPFLWKGYPSMTYAVENQGDSPLGFRQAIAEWMKLAGRAASRFCRDNGIPAIRRASKPLQGSTAGDTTALLSLRKSNGFVDPFECIKRNMYAAPGVATLHPHGHWALGIPEGEGYCRVTSPLRRYGDLIMHWQIKHALLPGNDRPLFSEKHLEPIMHRLYEQEKATTVTEGLYNRYWSHAYLTRYIHGQRRKHGADFNPFPNLVGKTMGSVGFDTMNSTGQVPVIVPDLGIQGELSGVDSRSQLPVGTPLLVKIAEIKMAMPPLLRLSLA